MRKVEVKVGKPVTAPCDKNNLGRDVCVYLQVEPVAMRRGGGIA